MTKQNLKFKSISIGLITAVFMSLIPNVNFALADSEIFNVSVYPKTNEVSINWYSSNVYFGELYYGLTKDEMNYKITSSNFTDWHSYNIKGLTSGTTYYFRLIDKNKKGQELTRFEDNFTTWGTKPSSQIYEQIFYLSFDNSFYSPKGVYPKELHNSDGIKIGVEPSVWQGSLQVKDKNSFVTYDAENIFNAGYGTVMVWARLENFSKDMTIWQTNDLKYALYFERGSNYNRIVARAGWNEKQPKKAESRYYFDTKGNGSNVWKQGEWHFIVMTWEGKINGTVKLYIDGELKDSTSYTNGSGPADFMIGNNYRGNMNWSEGQIDDFKMYDWVWDSTWIRNEYHAKNLNQQKDLVLKTGQVAGIKVRYFKDGKLIRDPDGKIYVLSHAKKIHISDMSAWRRLGNRPYIQATWDEVNQYQDGGKFYSWSRYPDGTLLKASGHKVYWVWDGEKRHIASESVFLRYGNEWQDIIVVSDAELDSYPTGLTYY